MVIMFNASFNVCVRTYVRACVVFFSFEGIVEFNATLNNISAISWRSVLFLEETEIPGKKTSTCHKILTNLIIKYCIEYISSVRDSNC